MSTKKAYDECMQDCSDPEQLRRLEEAEDKLAAATGFKTMKEKGEEQPAPLKALDCVDAITPTMRIYNVCRAKTTYDTVKGRRCSCGLAFPAKMWSQPDPRRWTFKCNVKWEA